MSRHEEARRILLALKSSSHRDRTERDRKTDRAYHVVKFLGTGPDAPPPPSDDKPRMRREVALIEALDTEEERQKRAMQGRRPDETADAFQQRRRLELKDRYSGPRWKWVLRNGNGTDRWEGKEDLLQENEYCLIFPPSNPDEPIKVCLVDHWIEMRKFVDFTAAKKEREQEDLRRKLRLAKELNAQSVQAFEEGNNPSGRRGGGPLPLASRQFSDAAAAAAAFNPLLKRQRMAEDMGGVSTEEIRRQDLSLDHTFGLAADRQMLDPDAFYDDGEAVDDDDEGREEYAEGENAADYAEDAIVAHEMMLKDEEEDEFDEEEEPDEDEDDGGDDEGSDDDADEEEEEERPDSKRVRTAPLQAVPVQATASTSHMPPVTFVPQKSLDEQVRDHIRQFVLDSNDRLQSSSLSDLVRKVREAFNVSKEVVAAAVKDTLIYNKAEMVFSLRKLG